MATTLPPPVHSSRPRPVAPMWHTVVLAGLFLLLALGGARLQHRAAAHGPDLPAAQNPTVLYLSLIAMQWGLVYFVWKAGLRRQGVTLREVIGGRWTNARDVAVDLGLALGVWGLWTGISHGADHWLGADHAASVRSLLPRQPLDIALWIALSISAGFSEELVFRGYFQRQFHALTGSAAVALGLQSLLFGISHGYQGLRACLMISVYGLLFGALALWRKSLRPGMAAHAWTDIAAGLLRL